MPALYGLLLTTLFAPANPGDFDKDILPIFQTHCVRCHGGERLRADLDVRSRAGLLKGGESGPALSPGSAEKSLLWIHVAADRMPPGKEKLTAKQKQVLRAWIDGGAPGADTPAPPPPPVFTAADRAFWSFVPPRRPIVPRIAGADNPIDALLLAELRRKGLDFSPPADRGTLIRRLTFDLTGLPPSPEEIRQFLNDSRPDAVERLVDRLLASPAYGERWGRHWLDVAGYADSEGILDADHIRTAAWRYRDYVVAALNADKPYDRFLQEQIAGDELTDYHTAFRRDKTLSPEVVEGLVATGFLRCAADTSRPDFVNIKNAPSYYYQTLDDTIKILSTATMGLTLHCARCHAHKFDPIPQRDYYQIQAIFQSAYRPSQWIAQVNRRLLQGTKAQLDENARLDAQIAALQTQQRLLTVRLVGHLLTDRLTGLMLALPQQRQQSDSLAQQIREHAARKHDVPEIRALYDLPGTVPTRLLRRGDYLNPGPEVQPGVLGVLTTAQPFEWQAPAADAPTSGRRLAFARWLTQPGHPLTARVFVNRVWMHHFGEGIVSTPENFGRSGSAPSHPALLDWLAVEFVESGWSLKRLHRWIVLSAAYRQSSRLDPQRHALAQKVDPENRLLWRQRLRRLEAEALRDSILAVSGNLNDQRGGPPVFVVPRGGGEFVTPPGPAGQRRSIYLQVRRSQPLTVLQVFDQPVMETNCTRRSTSTVSAQALTLLNSDFLVEQGETFADRLLREGGSDLADRAVWLAYGRSPTPGESAALNVFLNEQAQRHGGGDTGRRRALADLCQMLLSSNEFAYID